MAKGIQLQKLFFINIFLLSTACINHSGDFPKAENALDAGREFIDGSLKGDFKRAKFYMLNDSDNVKELRKIENDYAKKSDTEKAQYYDASIIINEDATIDDITHIINYHNSYDKIDRKIKVINQNNTWLVDFKYTFNGNL